MELLGVVATGAVLAVLRLLLELADDAPFVHMLYYTGRSFPDPWAGRGP